MKSIIKLAATYDLVFGKLLKEENPVTHYGVYETIALINQFEMHLKNSAAAEPIAKPQSLHLSPKGGKSH